MGDAEKDELARMFMSPDGGGMEGILRSIMSGGAGGGGAGGALSRVIGQVTGSITEKLQRGEIDQESILRDSMNLMRSMKRR
jgi:hypothetical protein